MSTVFHIIDVGQGNMILLLLADGTVMLYDCNVTDANANKVLEYLRKALPKPSIDIFVNSHRDADHMRGVQRVHTVFPIKKVWDSGVTGDTPDSPEYRQYMQLRRNVGFREVEAMKRWDFGNTRLRIMNSKNDALDTDANAQSIVMKVEQRRPANGAVLGSMMLTGDSSAVAWRYSIVRSYDVESLSSSLLLASHHGSLTFFDDPRDKKHYYLDHLRKISPDVTIVSVGDNSFGHPEEKALEFYETGSAGSKQGDKVFRTDIHGNIRVTLKTKGGWELNKRQ